MFAHFTLKAGHFVLSCFNQSVSKRRICPTDWKPTQLLISFMYTCSWPCSCFKFLPTKLWIFLQLRVCDVGLLCWVLNGCLVYSPHAWVPFVCRGGDGEQPSCFSAPLPECGGDFPAAVHPRFGQITCQAGTKSCLLRELSFLWKSGTSRLKYPNPSLCSRPSCELHGCSPSKGQSCADTSLAMPVQLLSVPPEGAQTPATTARSVCSPC